MKKITLMFEYHYEDRQNVPDKMVMLKEVLNLMHWDSRLADPDVAEVQYAEFEDVDVIPEGTPEDYGNLRTDSVAVPDGMESVLSKPRQGVRRMLRWDSPLQAEPNQRP